MKLHLYTAYYNYVSFKNKHGAGVKRHQLRMRIKKVDTNSMSPQETDDTTQKLLFSLVSFFLYSLKLLRKISF